MISLDHLDTVWMLFHTFLALSIICQFIIGGPRINPTAHLKYN